MHSLVTRRRVSTTLVTYGMGLVCACKHIIDNCLCLPLGTPTHLFVGHPGGVRKRRVRPVHGPRRLPSLLGRYNLPVPTELVLRKSRLSFARCGHLTTYFPRARILPYNATLVQGTQDIGARVRVRVFHHSNVTRTGTCRRVPSICEPKVASYRLSVRVRHLVHLRNYLNVFHAFKRDVRVFVKDLLTKSGTATPTPCSFTLKNRKLSPSLPVDIGNTLLRPNRDFVISVKNGFCNCVNSVDHMFSVKGLPRGTSITRRIYLSVRRTIMRGTGPNTIYRSLCGLTVSVIAGTNFTSGFVKTARGTGFVNRNVKLRVGRVPILTPHVGRRLRPNVIFTLRPGVILPNVNPINVRGS